MQGEAETTRALARIVGPTLVAGGLFLLSRRDDLTPLLEAFTDNDALGAVAGFTALVAGLCMLAFHNRISTVAALTLTLLGLLMVARGLMLLFAPTLVTFAAAWLIEIPHALDATGVIVALFGAWLSTVGFSARPPPIGS